MSNSEKQTNLAINTTCRHCPFGKLIYKWTG